MSPADPATKPTHVLFVGAGAVGCFYASRLHHPSHQVHASLTARSNYAAIAEAGVTLQTHSFGDYTFAPHAVFPSVDAAAAAPHAWDYVVVTTKALPDRADEAALVAPLVAPATTCLVLIQNGVGVEAPYRARFPRNPIVSAVTVVSAEQTRPGTIRQNRWTRVSLGPYGGGLAGQVADADAAAALVREGTRRMEALAGWWTALGGIRDVETHTELELQTIRWHKLCINAAFNPGAVLSGGLGNADQLRDPELRRHLLGVMQEIWDAAPAVLGRPLPDGLATPDKIVRSTERNTGAKPSMLLDWEAGRPLELEVIAGNPLRLARAAGVEMPRLQSVYALLRSMQAQRDAAKKESKL